MTSRVIYGRDFTNAVNLGLAPENFRYRFLVEGDSWMDRSSAIQASLPHALATTFSTAGEDVLIINLSMFGDTLRRIGDCLNDEFSGWINSGLPWKFDALLLSAGGNDFIDAARDPAPGEGLLRQIDQDHPALTAALCFRPEAMATLVTEYLDPNFDKLYDAVRDSEHGGIPIFINGYDIPTARKAPAMLNGRTWLYEAYTQNGVPERLWPEVTERMFLDIETTVSGWTMGRSGIFQVPTVGTLVPATPGETGESGDWLNEIHPNAKGWRKLAAVWHKAITHELP